MAKATPLRDGFWVARKTIKINSHYKFDDGYAGGRRIVSAENLNVLKAHYKFGDSDAGNC
jgi:hypothetical protein